MTDPLLLKLFDQQQLLDKKFDALIEHFGHLQNALEQIVQRASLFHITEAQIDVLARLLTDAMKELKEEPEQKGPLVN